MANSNIIVDRTTTWHAIGKDVQECKNMQQVLRAWRPDNKSLDTRSPTWYNCSITWECYRFQQ